MAERSQAARSVAEFYSMKTAGEDPVSDEQKLLDSVFLRLEKMQKRITIEKIAALEHQLTDLDAELTVLIENYTI